MEKFVEFLDKEETKIQLIDDKLSNRLKQDLEDLGD